MYDLFWLLFFALIFLSFCSGLYFLAKLIFRFIKKKIPKKDNEPENVIRMPINSFFDYKDEKKVSKFDDLDFYDIALKEIEFDAKRLYDRYDIAYDLAIMLIKKLIDEGHADLIDERSYYVKIREEELKDELNELRSYVYIMKDPHQDIFKIGKADGLNIRHTQLSTQWHSEMIFLFAIKSKKKEYYIEEYHSYKLEDEIQDYYEDKQVKQHSESNRKPEWFKLTWKQVNEIAVKYQDKLVFDIGLMSTGEVENSQERPDNVIAM